ncbi:hypothetical protein TEQG_05926 [Trichophyton equinum CBS 127.97]|nr:hypothetical protein TEQG_05926 [Trichophyton equinum CBS 127.97]
MTRMKTKGDEGRRRTTKQEEEEDGRGGLVTVCVLAVPRVPSGTHPKQHCEACNLVIRIRPLLFYLPLGERLVSATSRRFSLRDVVPSSTSNFFSNLDFNFNHSRYNRRQLASGLDRRKIAASSQSQRQAKLFADEKPIQRVDD